MSQATTVSIQFKIKSSPVIWLLNATVNICFTTSNNGRMDAEEGVGQGGVSGSHLILGGTNQKRFSSFGINVSHQDEIWSLKLLQSYHPMV